MESLTMMLWIFVVPLHAYVLQPSAHVVALEDPGSQEMTWHEGGKEPLPLAEDPDSNGEDGAEPEGGPRAEAGEVEMGELYDADGQRQADHEKKKTYKEGHREGKMEEHRNEDEEKEGLLRITDVEEEGELGADLEEEEKRSANRDEIKKEEVEGDDNEEDESPVEEPGKAKTRVDDGGEVNRNLGEYRFEDAMDKMQRNSSPSIVTDIPHVSPNPGLPVETDTSHFNPILGHSIETDVSLLNPTSGPNLNTVTDIPHVSTNHGLSIEADIRHWSSYLSRSVETDSSHLSPNPGHSTEIDISLSNVTLSPDHNLDQNYSVPHQELDRFQILLPTAVSTVTPTVSPGRVKAGESEEATFTPVKLNSELVEHWNLTGSSRPHLREEEGLVPKAIEVSVDSFKDLTDTNSATQEQKRSEKKRSKFNQPALKPKKKKIHPAKQPQKTRSKQENVVQAEDKRKSLKKDKNKKNKKKEQKENKNTEKETPSFGYFNDNYCPSDCVCYGRVVQCSDKRLDKIPYGIPYDARYVLLMNNRISGIQLDLLREYITLEFLVLSSNILTDGSIEGAFEGMKQLKRLYLDSNRLNSVPTDLPLSLAELRLDGNNISGMSEAAWAHCPSLQILSLNNNTLKAETVPEGVFTPLTSLRTLSLMHNHLTSVPLHLPTNIKELYLRGNHIDRVPSGAFAEGSDLLVLDLSANRLTNKGLTKGSLKPLVRLENLSLEGNPLRNIPKHLPPTLRTLNLEGNAITSISKAAFLGLPHLEHLGLSRNQINRVAPGAFWGLPALHQLELDRNALRQVPRRLPPSLNSVSLVHNKIHSIPRDSFCTKGKESPLSNLVRVHLEHNLIELADLDTQAFNCLRGYQVIHFY